MLHSADVVGKWEGGQGIEQLTEPLTAIPRSAWDRSADFTNLAGRRQLQILQTNERARHIICSVFALRSRWQTQASGIKATRVTSPTRAIRILKGRKPRVVRTNRHPGRETAILSTIPWIPRKRPAASKATLTKTR